MNPLKWFVKINYQLCNKIEYYLPLAKPDITNLYAVTVAEYANRKPHQIIIDVGGGRSTPFARYLIPELKHKIIVIDSSKEELKNNTDANQIIIADMNKKFPLKPSSVDFIVSRYTLEHLENLSGFVLNSQKVLKNGGYSIHLFSCKFSLFALLNQVIPAKFSRDLLNLLIPNSKHIRGYKTNYDNCSYDKITTLLKQNGFKIKSMKINFYGSRYFRFFIPLYLISIIYELIIQTLGLNNLCSYILFITKKDTDA